MFEHISSHLKVRQEYSAARRIFKSLLGVCKCGRTRTSVFDILRKVRKQVIEGIRNSSHKRIFQSNSLMVRKICPSMYRMDHFTQQINKKSLSWLNVYAKLSKSTKFHKNSLQDFRSCHVNTVRVQYNADIHYSLSV